MDTYIELKRMVFYANHGVMPEENLIGNKFEVNLKLKYNFIAACQSDNVNDTLNYAEVFDVVKKEMQITSKLLEHVANRIFASLKEKFCDITIVELRLAKFNPPVDGEVEKAEVILMER